MDIKRDTSGKWKKQVLYSVVAGAALIAITVFLSGLERAAPTVDSATLWMDSVQRGELLLERRGAGTLVPEEIRAVAARSAGRVEPRSTPTVSYGSRTRRLTESARSPGSTPKQGK